MVGRLVERFLPLSDQTEKEPGLGRARSRSQNGRASLLGAGQVALLNAALDDRQPVTARPDRKPMRRNIDDERRIRECHRPSSAIATGPRPA